MVSTHFVYCHDRFEINPNYGFFQKLYTVPTMIQQTSINHFVDEILGDRSEPFSCATSYYLLVSNDGCQTTWHQDFSATSVMYTVLTGEKIFFLVAPTQSNIELFNQYTSQETDAQLVDTILIANNSPNVAEFHCIQNVLVSGIN